MLIVIMMETELLNVLRKSHLIGIRKSLKLTVLLLNKHVKVASKGAAFFWQLQEGENISVFMDRLIEVVAYFRIIDLTINKILSTLFFVSISVD